MKSRFLATAAATGLGILAINAAERPSPNAAAFPNQHYNSLTSWGIGSNGEIKHVYA